MPEKVGFWKRLEKNKKLQVLFFCVSMAVLIAVYVPTVSFLHRESDKNIMENLELATDYRVISEIEKVNLIDSKIQILGWVLRLDSQNTNIRLWLNAVDGSDANIFYAKNTSRPEIENYFDEDWEFGKTGFEVDIETEEIQDTCYEIILILDFEREIQTEEETIIKKECKKVATGKYLYNGELFHYNPRNFNTPQIKDAEIAEILEQAIPCACLDNGEMYVYQYKNYLYWIIPSDYKYMEEKLYIPCQIRTSNADKLPENMKESGFDHQGFYFEDKEIVIKDSRYRVAVNTLSQQYPITYIATGIYNQENQTWVEMARFHIRYSLMRQ